MAGVKVIRRDLMPVDVDSVYGFLPDCNAREFVFLVVIVAQQLSQSLRVA